MPDMRAESQRLVENPSRPPTPVAVLAEKVRIRRRRRRWRRGVMGSTAIAAAGVIVGLVVAGDGGAHPFRVVTSPPTTTSRPAVMTPAGFVRVDYDKASVAVPAGWTVMTTATSFCTFLNNVVMLGLVKDTAACKQNSASPVPSYVRIVPSVSPGQGAIQTVINGHRGYMTPYRGPAPSEQMYTFPDLGVTVVAGGPFTSKIIGTIDWSDSYRALHPITQPVVPSDWREVSYRGLTMRVPSSWPIERLGATDTNPGICGPPEFVSPHVFLGEGGSVPSCPPKVATATAGVDSLWIRPYSTKPAETPPAGALPIANGDRRALLIPDSIEPETQPVVHLLVQPAANAPYLAVDIGLSPEQPTAQQIVASLAETPYLLPALQPTLVPSSSSAATSAIPTSTTGGSTSCPTVGAVTTVPDIIGLTAEAAYTVLGKAGLLAGTQPTSAETTGPTTQQGSVAAQAPSPGSRVMVGSKVELSISGNSTPSSGGGYLAPPSSIPADWCRTP